MRCNNEFIGEDKFVIARTEEETDVICKHLHSLGYKWYSGDSYLDLNYWDDNSIVCYKLSGGTAHDLEYDEPNVFEFDEVFNPCNFIRF